MTCENCSKLQDSLEYVVYVRFGISNIMIVGCKDHVTQFVETYNNGQRLLREKEFEENAKEN